MQIKHESWCWKQNTYKLDVRAEAESGKTHIKAPEFVHEGYSHQLHSMSNPRANSNFHQTCRYMLNSVVSHDAKLVATLDSSPNERQTFELTKGTNRFCLR